MGLDVGLRNGVYVRKITSGTKTGLQDCPLVLIYADGKKAFAFGSARWPVIVPQYVNWGWPIRSFSELLDGAVPNNLATLLYRGVL